LDGDCAVELSTISIVCRVGSGTGCCWRLVNDGVRETTGGAGTVASTRSWASQAMSTISVAGGTRDFLLHTNSNKQLYNVHDIPPANSSDVAINPFTVNPELSRPT